MKGIFIRKSLAFMIFASWGAASLSGVEIAPDTRKVEPLFLATDEPAVLAAQRQLAGTAGRPDFSVPVFIRLSAEDPDLPLRIRDLAGDAAPITPRLFTAQIPRDAARYISNWPQVAYLEAAKRVRPLLELSRHDVSADNVQAGTGLPAPFDAGITGDGTFVGSVDTGLSGRNPDFHAGDQLTSPRVVHAYASSRLPIFDLSPDPFVDEEGHGTHVAGIAVGNGLASAGLYTGMAPGVSGPVGGILVGKTTREETDVVTAVKDLLSFAGSTPVAINISLGTMIGPHDGTSSFETAMNAMATGGPGSKRVITVAAGNEKAGNVHFHALVPDFGSTTAFLTIAPASVTAPAIPMVDIWADGGDRYSATATISAGTASVRRDSPPNGATHIEVFFNNNSSSTASASITLQRTRNGGTGNVDAYIDSVLFGGGRSNIFSLSTPAGTLTEPANADNVLAVGSFDTKTFNPNTGAYSAASQDISPFSSMGPTRTGIMKPDLTAPGSLLFSARSFDASFSPGQIVPNDNDYVVMAGTSMAAPHVAGIAALVWESNPSLTGAQARERIRRTAVAPTDGSSPPNNTWGFGKVNALQAVSRTVAAITAPATAAPRASVTLTSGDSSGAYDPATYSYALRHAWTLLQKPDGSDIALASSSASTSFTPDVPGDYTVSLTVSQSAPANVPAGNDNAVIHVNNVPTAVITGPSSTDNVVPVTFTGSASDPDVADFGQSIALHWVLVSRPTGSGIVALTPVGGTADATLNPDVAGLYEIGLRADDGLDNSALAVLAFRSGPAPPSGGGGGGGCSVARPGATGSGTDAGTVFFLLIASAGMVALRHRVRQPGK